MQPWRIQELKKGGGGGDSFFSDRCQPRKSRKSPPFFFRFQKGGGGHGPDVPPSKSATEDMYGLMWIPHNLFDWKLEKN